ncbi:EAL domain-containing protein [Thermicanus aegyptius]|uniref:EAL domain-containing protein n=1 Tax=Thermicanus aegyptius TaxID=94009 RepID=UPI000490A6A0|nr:EAL domain-containing protein [Thermicanus aegyptius]
MLSLAKEPIINLVTGEILSFELLCRPRAMSIQEFFSTYDRIDLWGRELACILYGIDLQKTFRSPITMNITLSSLSFFLKTNLTWEGGVEIVEWGPKTEIDLAIATHLLKERGLMVFADDLKLSEWEMWRDIQVDGYKVRKNDVEETLLEELLGTQKILIVEEIETEEEKEWAKEIGFRFGQGYLFNTKKGEKNNAKKV